jgi:hypothetical protein|tara:strand:+ start:59 stop:991 length:933 start_codon:yes stop_codon:yes gene_type:complete
MAKIHTHLMSNLSPVTLEEKGKVQDYYKNNSGFDNDNLVEPHPNYHNPHNNETDIAGGKNGQYIIIGRDRPSDEGSGYGGKGHSHSSCIDIIAGLSGRFAKETNEKGEKIYTNKSTSLDAARIYVSQKTDIDENFNLAAGFVGNPGSRSGIAIKADGVRIIGREGIKLITGVDNYNSQGIKIDAIQGIDLIAGNNDYELEPLIKGDKTVEALSEVIELVADLNGLLLTHFVTYTRMLASFAVHTHITTAPGNPTSPSPDAAAFAFNEFTVKVTPFMTDILAHQQNCIMVEQNYLWPWGEGYICSAYNNTN